MNSNLPQFFQPAGIDVDPQNGDVYVSDGEAASGNHRVAVLDRDGKFLRQWQLHRTEAEKDIAQVLHCLGLSNDGLIYVCDRRAHRIQVFDKMGNFKKNIDVPWKQHTPYDGKRRTGGWGSAAALDFSRDPGQRFLFAVNEDNEQIEILDRQSGKVLSSFGHGAGHFPGQFTHAHGIAVDSRGNGQEGSAVQDCRSIEEAGTVGGRFKLQDVVQETEYRQVFMITILTSEEDLREAVLRNREHLRTRPADRKVVSLKKK